MVITVKFKLNPNKFIASILDTMASDYISAVNDILDYQYGQLKWDPLTTATVNAPLPSAILNQCIRDTKSIYKDKNKKNSVLKKPAMYINNQNYSIFEDGIAFPLWIDSKSRKTKIPAEITSEIYNTLLENKNSLGLLRVCRKNNKYMAFITYEKQETPVVSGDIIMGVDLGIKCPAVCRVNNNKTKFVGNGRMIKYKRRQFAKTRKKLGKLKKPQAIKRISHKENDWMNDQDHKISREVVNFALENNVSVIKLEQLANIRATTRTSRKNNKSLHNWSFYRLQNYIMYKAQLVGIQVEVVNPAYTSQKCPSCGTNNKAKDRLYKCNCGYKQHRDIVGAINIMQAPALNGKSSAA